MKQQIVLISKICCVDLLFYKFITPQVAEVAGLQLNIVYNISPRTDLQQFFFFFFFFFFCIFKRIDIHLMRLFYTRLSTAINSSQSQDETVYLSRQRLCLNGFSHRQCT